MCTDGLYDFDLLLVDFYKEKKHIFLIAIMKLVANFSKVLPLKTFHNFSSVIGPHLYFHVGSRKNIPKHLFS
jgi:hypothetical protein